MHRKNLTVGATLALILLAAPMASAVDECVPADAVYETQIVTPAVDGIPAVPAVTEVETQWSLADVIEGWEATGDTEVVVAAVPGIPAVDAVTHQEFIFERTVTSGGTSSYDVGPYTVSTDGVTLNKGTFKKHGHVNWKVTGVDGKQRPGGIHFDPNNGHPGGQYIGKNFVPITLAPGECITWVQVDGYNDHLGEGKHKVKVCAATTTTERTDWVRESPAGSWEQVDERTVTTSEAVPAVPAIDEVLKYEHQRTVEISPAVDAVLAVPAITEEVLVIPAKTCPLPTDPEEIPSPPTTLPETGQPSLPSPKPPVGSPLPSPSSSTPLTTTPTTSPVLAVTSASTPKPSTSSEPVLATTGPGSWLAMATLASALIVGGMALMGRRGRQQQ